MAVAGRPGYFFPISKGIWDYFIVIYPVCFCVGINEGIACAGALRNGSKVFSFFGAV